MHGYIIDIEPCSSKDHHCTSGVDDDAADDEHCSDAAAAAGSARAGGWQRPDCVRLTWRHYEALTSSTENLSYSRLHTPVIIGATIYLLEILFHDVLLSPTSQCSV